MDAVIPHPSFAHPPRGLAMGVDDGCEPTAEEVAQGV
jgi:hypothetical protein